MEETGKETGTVAWDFHPCIAFVGRAIHTRNVRMRSSSMRANEVARAIVAAVAIHAFHLLSRHGQSLCSFCSRTSACILDFSGLSMGENATCGSRVSGPRR